MRRRLFNLGSLISLLLCTLTISLWVRSYFEGYLADWRKWDGGVEFVTCTGRMGIAHYHVLRHTHSFVGFRHEDVLPDIPWDKVIPGSRLHFGSFAAGWNDTGAIAGYMVILPYWLFVLLTAAAPTFWLVGRLRRKRHKRGFEPIQHPRPSA